MIIELEINGARVIISGDNLTVNLTDAAPVPATKVPTVAADAKHIVKLADIFCNVRKHSVSSLSTRVFNDGKRIDRVRSGKGVTVATYTLALAWFSVHWPKNTDWPHDVPRPASAEISA